MFEQYEQYVRTVPLYKRLYGDRINRLCFAKELRELPILEKQHIATSFPNEWLTERVRKAISNCAVEYTSTSGTSGDRMQIIRQPLWWRQEFTRAYRYNSLLRNFPVETGRKAILTTAVCSGNVCYLDTPTLEQRIVNDALYLNMTHSPNSWSKAELLRIVEEIDTYCPYYFDADPIYLALFIKALARHAVTAPRWTPSCLTLCYELVTARTRRFVQRFWPIPTYNFYGTTETGLVYVESDVGRLERYPDLSLVNFSPYRPDYGLYYLIVTSFKNDYMPLVRYRIGDLVKTAGHGVEKCQTLEELDRLPVECICGRARDTITNRAGVPVTPADVNNALAPLGDRILIYQVIVRNNKQVIMRYVTEDDTAVTAAQANDIQDVLISLFATNDVRLQFELDIAPEPSGKFCNLKTE